MTPETPPKPPSAKETAFTMIVSMGAIAFGYVLVLGLVLLLIYLGFVFGIFKVHT
jgi:hypothetical protein